MLNEIKTDNDKDYIIKHLLLSGDFADAQLLRTKLSKLYYKNEDINYTLDLTPESIINILNELKK